MALLVGVERSPGERKKKKMGIIIGKAKLPVMQ